MEPHEIINQLCEERQLSQKQVYTAIDMKQSTYSAKARGDRPFTREELKKIAAFFGVPLSYLLPAPINNVSFPFLTEEENKVANVFFKILGKIAGMNGEGEMGMEGK